MNVLRSLATSRFGVNFMAQWDQKVTKKGEFFDNFVPGVWRDAAPGMDTFIYFPEDPSKFAPG